MTQKNMRSRPDAAKHTDTAAFISVLIYYIFFGSGTHERQVLFLIPNVTAFHVIWSRTKIVKTGAAYGNRVKPSCGWFNIPRIDQLVIRPPPGTRIGVVG